MFRRPSRTQWLSTSCGIYIKHLEETFSLNSDCSRPRFTDISVTRLLGHMP